MNLPPPAPLARPTALRLLRFSGRTGRRGFWWLQAALAGILLLSACCDRLLFGPGTHPVSAAFMPALLFLCAAASARRLHDRNYRGSWLLLPPGLFLAAVATTRIAAEAGSSATPLWSIQIPLLLVMDALFLIAGLSCLWLLVLLLRPGQASPNRFGPEPQGRDHTRDNADD